MFVRVQPSFRLQFLVNFQKRFYILFCKNKQLVFGVKVARQILVLKVEVRFLEGQQRLTTNKYDKYMTEQELIQENEKLRARLQKAISVFTEQKNTISRLTVDRDDARNEVAKLNERVAQLEEATKSIDEQDSNFFKQVEEIESLSAKLKEQTDVNNVVNNENKTLRKQINDIANTFNDFVSTSKTTMENIVNLMQVAE